MDWLIENLDVITSMIGTAYIAVRLAVYLTPTKKDDAVLAKAEGFWKKIVVVLSKIAGLDIMQGVNRPVKRSRK